MQKKRKPLAAIVDSLAMPFVVVAQINNRINSRERAAYDVNFEIITFPARVGILYVWSKRELITSWVDRKATLLFWIQLNMLENAKHEG